MYRRMEAERKRVANELRSEGSAEAEKIRADADRQREVIIADAYRDAQKVKGEGRCQGGGNLCPGLWPESRVLCLLPQHGGVSRQLQIKTTCWWSNPTPISSNLHEESWPCAATRRNDLDVASGLRVLMLVLEGLMPYRAGGLA